MNAISYKKIDKHYKKDVINISIKCFFDDDYYNYLGKGKEKQKKLHKMFKKSYKIGLKIGEFVGIFLKEELIGFAKIYNYEKLKQNKKLFKTVFDYDKSDYVQDLDTFLQYANKLSNAYYMVAICVIPSMQHQQIGTNCVQFLTKKYKGRTLFADVDNPLTLSMYKKQNFEIIKISEKFYFVKK